MEVLQSQPTGKELHLLKCAIWADLPCSCSGRMKAFLLWYYVNVLCLEYGIVCLQTNTKLYICFNFVSFDTLMIFSGQMNRTKHGQPSCLLILVHILEDELKDGASLRLEDIALYKISPTLLFASLVSLPPLTGLPCCLHSQEQVLPFSQPLLLISSEMNRAVLQLCWYSWQQEKAPPAVCSLALTLILH